MLENGMAIAMSVSNVDLPVQGAPDAPRLLPANAVHRSRPQP